MLNAYMNDDITVLYYEGSDIHNTPLDTIDVPMKAYVNWDTHLLNKISGKQVVGSPAISRAIVYTMAARLITHAEIIKIDSIEYTILDIFPGKDFSRNHQEIHIQ